MKYFSLLLITFITTSCGGNQVANSDGFTYKRTQEDFKKAKIEKQKAGYDLANKGIGPIKNLTFKEINQDLVLAGAATFRQKCTVCHYTDKRLIGPPLKGIYERRSPEWVVNLLLNTTEMLKKDPIAIALLKEYNNIQMLNQNLSESEALSLAEFLRTL